MGRLTQRSGLARSGICSNVAIFDAPLKHMDMSESASRRFSHADSHMRGPAGLGTWVRLHLPHRSQKQLHKLHPTAYVRRHTCTIHLPSPTSYLDGESIAILAACLLTHCTNPVRDTRHATLTRGGVTSPQASRHACLMVAPRSIRPIALPIPDIFQDTQKGIGSHISGARGPSTKGLGMEMSWARLQTKAARSGWSWNVTILEANSEQTERVASWELHKEAMSLRDPFRSKAATFDTPWNTMSLFRARSLFGGSLGASAPSRPLHICSSDDPISVD